MRSAWSPEFAPHVFELLVDLSLQLHIAPPSVEGKRQQDRNDNDQPLKCKAGPWIFFDHFGCLLRLGAVYLVFMLREDPIRTKTGSSVKTDGFGNKQERGPSPVRWETNIRFPAGTGRYLFAPSAGRKAADCVSARSTRAWNRGSPRRGSRYRSY